METSTVVCPITQEPVHQEVILAGVSFELTAILDLVRIRQSHARHPYTRAPFSDSDLIRIYVHAFQLAPRYLAEHGWLRLLDFLTDAREEPEPNLPSRPPAPAATQPAEQEDQEPQPTPAPCTIHELSLCFLLSLFGLLLVILFIRFSETISLIF